MVDSAGDTVTDPALSTVFDDSNYLPASSGLCPAGHYCPIGSSYAIPCAAGTYNPDIGAHACADCPEFQYCATPGLTAPTGYCALGYECFKRAIFAKPNDYSTGAPCLKGNYCANG